MKSNLIKLSLLFSFGGLLFTGCVASYNPYQSNLMDSRINSDLTKANYFSNTTTKDEVLKQLGNSVKTENIGSSQILHFCSTRTGYDDFVAITIEKYKFIDKKEYKIMSEDVNGASGHCSKFARSLSEVAILERQREEKKRIEEEKKQAFLDKIEQYEKGYFQEYEEIKENAPKLEVVWVQPRNKKEPCKVYVEYSDINPLKDYSYKLFWDGECKNGYAYGLGREIEKANLTDRWQIGIYDKGQPKGSSIYNDILHSNYGEGESNYGASSHQIIRRVFEKNGDINVFYETGTSGNLKEPALLIVTSPFLDNAKILRKIYPNFRYEYIDFTNNPDSQKEFKFAIFNKENNKNGWSYEKFKNGNIKGYVYDNEKEVSFIDQEQQSNNILKQCRRFGDGSILCPGNKTYRTLNEFNNKFDLNSSNEVVLPSKFYNRLENIIKEINDAANSALSFQNNAQLIKKQYLRKICKESLKIDFMDNDEYKELCENKYEKELFAKINAKFQKITEEKIAKLEEQRFNQQQAKEEQYRQQLLAIERQKLAAQQSQARAAQDTADAANQANFQNSLNNLNQQLQNNSPKFYNVTPTFGGGYNIIGF